MKHLPMKVSKLSEFLQICEILNAPHTRYVFRGVPKESYSLKSSIERDIPESDIKASGYGIYEAMILKRFYENEHLYTPLSSYEKTDLTEVWSIIQHYGGRTRLLDFTQSIAVALFFAIYDHRNVENPTIWCIPDFALESEIGRMFLNRLSRAEELKQKGFLKIPGLIEGWSMIPLFRMHPEINAVLNYLLRISLNSYSGEEELVDCVIPIRPPRPNHRLAAQNGLFLLPLNSRNTFLGNLVNMYPGAPVHSILAPFEPQDFDIQTIRAEIAYKNIISLHFSNYNYKELRDFLLLMNVDAKSLFPDFPGLIQMLSMIGPIREDLRKCARQTSSQDAPPSHN